MDKCNINYIFDEKKDINEIFIKVLSKQLKKYIEMICKDKEREPSSYTYLSLKEGEKN